MSINLVYNSPRFSIVEYPKHEAYEILNKDVGLIGFITGSVAVRFRKELEEAFDSQHALENSEELLENLLLSFDVFMSLPAVVH
ncbi:conserved hypothetical protein [Candidatus Ichthyocystis hellenicum]|uniref:Uncharacterized protein n=1 Tax=Candidatus Ichthyocystis hellenicum TaxID=1561003 RepID=A0A0S4M335_9BURK|nr:DUF3567 family protein [Candidatus Ichthyocystis hellenicum]CUT18094.1 conserved hypothetical protein [Candidatus Ichthyocystis hellenicum]